MTHGSAPAGWISNSDVEGHFVRSPDVLWRQSGNMILVRTVADPQIVELVGTGVLLWVALAEPVTADELANDLATVVEAHLDVVTRDVRAALADLVLRGLVTQLGMS